MFTSPALMPCVSVWGMGTIRDAIPSTTTSKPANRRTFINGSATDCTNNGPLSRILEKARLGYNCCSGLRRRLPHGFHVTVHGLRQLSIYLVRDRHDVG